ncbi:MAG TPA: hypothetical protein VK996_12430 [Ramlibacter sp.]|nr:hypothetical protein [Ramlibacter sp.]
MAEILAIGCTHYPMLLWPDDRWTAFHQHHLDSPRIPEARKDPASWPLEMQKEWGDNGANALASAVRHRTWLVDRFRKLRKEIDDFNPDFVLIWGDDQYENFTEDLIPPFCVYIQDKFESRPYEKDIERGYGNMWGFQPDKMYTTRGHPNGAKYLTTQLLEMGYPMPYSYKGLHHQGLAHAFINTLLFLDYDNKGEGWNYPVVPFHVNCYGSSVIRNRGSFALNAEPDSEPDPPAPSARLCYEVGAATARALKASPWRVAVVGSSSWSHAFLTKKHDLLWPDVESDRERFEELRTGRQELWKNLEMSQIEDSGQQELLNWVCLAGAMTELDAKPEFIEMTATYIFNSPKVMMVARSAA